MTINTHATQDNAAIQSISSDHLAPEGIGCNSLGYITNFLADQIPGTYDCDSAASALDSFKDLVALTFDGTQFLRPTVANFSCPSGNGAGSVKCQVAGGGVVGYCDVLFVGGVCTIDFNAHPTYNWPALFTLSADTVSPSENPSIGYAWEVGYSSGGIITFSFNIPKVVAFNTARQFFGDNVLACSLGPTALPSVGGAVKCANFSKIFNPLGIPLRSK